MIKEIETKKIKTYEITVGKETYHVYTCVNDDDEKFTNFYLHNIKCGIIYFMVGCICDETYTEEKIINNNLTDWLYTYRDICDELYEE